MDISIITPNLNSGYWLRMCVASVADQEDAEVEHIIQDAGSNDDSLDGISTDQNLFLFQEADEGMYDAINRGIRRSAGEIVAHLNSDEQYLPGALAAVKKCFEDDPNLDVLLADSVIVNAQGNFISCRKSFRPWRLTRFADNPSITSSIFMRRSAIERYGLYFETKYRVISDSLWIRRCVTTQGIRIGVFRHYTTAFTESGDNLDLTPNAAGESRIARSERPCWARLFEVPLKWVGRTRRWILGGYHQKPFEYCIYTRAKPSVRTCFYVEKPTCVWWNRTPRNASRIYRIVKTLIGNIRGHGM